MKRRGKNVRRRKNASEKKRRKGKQKRKMRRKMLKKTEKPEQRSVTFLSKQYVWVCHWEM